MNEKSAPKPEFEFEYVPGCRYLGPEDAAERDRALLPGDYDHSAISRKRLDVRYGTLDEQLADVFYPETGDGPFPLIFYIHGGGWSMGDRHSNSIACILPGALARGFAVATLDYRLSPKTKFPENLYDVKTAVRWARANAGEYRFDPARFGVIGDSAGGYFALMLAVTAGNPALEGEQYGWAGVSSAVQACCDLYGPVDMERDWAEYYIASGVKRWPMQRRGAPTMEELEFSSVSAPNLAPLVCPHRYVHPGIPPVLLLHGENDGLVPCENSVLMAERIRAVCGEGRAKLLLYPERNHADRDFMTPESADLAAEFFARVFRGENPFDG